MVFDDIGKQPMPLWSPPLMCFVKFCIVGVKVIGVEILRIHESLTDKESRL